MATQSHMPQPVEGGSECAATTPTGAERRTAQRFALDESVAVHPISGASKLEGRIRDLSAGGCRLEVDTRLLTGAMLRVELQFKIHGYTFRLVGVTAGRRTKTSIGIRFVDLSERRRAELVELLTMLEANAQQRTGQSASSAPNQHSSPRTKPIEVSVRTTVGPATQVSAAQAARIPTAKVAAAVNRTQAGAVAELAVQVPNAQSASAAASGDRRAFRRLRVDTRARLYLVKTGIQMTGAIQDLSMAGCRIVTEEPFNVGIYVRVEAEFFLHGLPFRLGGVSQAIIDKKTIGVRFLDMSDRKREQLAELIEEIQAALNEAEKN